MGVPWLFDLADTMHDITGHDGYGSIRHWHHDYRHGSPDDIQRTGFRYDHQLCRHILGYEWWRDFSGVL